MNERDGKQWISDEFSGMALGDERLNGERLGNPAGWLIRAQHNRCLPEGEKLWSHTCEGAPLGEITFMMASRQGQKAREVRQQLWARRVTIPTGGTTTVPATCVVAREIGAPAGTSPVEWRLLTNRAADSVQAVVELIDWYRAPWEIERFFHVLKNGCVVEELQLSTIERLERALALFMVVSWRIMHLMQAGRACPDLDASLFFDPNEIHGAYLLAKRKPPAEPPTINDVLRLIATLGRIPGPQERWGARRGDDLARATAHQRDRHHHPVAAR